MSDQGDLGGDAVDPFDLIVCIKRTDGDRLNSACHHVFNLLLLYDSRSFRRHDHLNIDIKFFRRSDASSFCDLPEVRNLVCYKSDRLALTRFFFGAAFSGATGSRTVFFLP